MYIPAHLTKEISDVLRIHDKLDGKIDEFQAASALKCVSGCAAAAKSQNIYYCFRSSAFTYELWQNGVAETILTKISDPSVLTICVFINLIFCLRAMAL